MAMTTEEPLKFRHIPTPQIEYDRTVSHMLNVEGPDEIYKLSIEASEAVRHWLRQYMDPEQLSRLRFESLIVPYMFEARRIGDRRGQKRAQSMLSGLFPGTE